MLLASPSPLSCYTLYGLSSSLLATAGILNGADVWAIRDPTCMFLLHSVFTALTSCMLQSCIYTYSATNGISPSRHIHPPGHLSQCHADVWAIRDPTYMFLPHSVLTALTSCMLQSWFYTYSSATNGISPSRHIPQAIFLSVVWIMQSLSFG
jgi:hypothetical protein